MGFWGWAEGGAMSEGWARSAVRQVCGERVLVGAARELACVGRGGKGRIWQT